MRINSALTTAASSFAIGVAALSAPAFAQSTGSIEFEKEIIVTGTRSGTQEVAGVSAPDTAKAKAVLTQENIERQNPGQTILDTINQIPGVSFQNNDAYGSSGGTLNIRGFSADRVSLTFDGVPLNDSGNYAVYSNQQIDPELIEQVNVNLGTTDVDSPTASAAGGTVNLRTKRPDRDFGVMLSGSAGQYDFMRIFAKVETGDLTESGLRAWFAMSRATNDNPFNNYGKVNKQQYNARIYLPLAGDDFISLAGHYNQNRNNFFGSLPLRLDATRTVGSASINRYPANSDERKYLINYPCLLDTPQAGVADSPAPAVLGASCGTEFDRRYNPSNTGNIRLSSRFTLSDSLVLTVDPSYQYVKANGGGTVTGREALRDIDPGAGVTNVAGYLSGAPVFGRDVNGDGDILDTVTVLAPSQTQTHRIGVIAGLRWEMDEHNTFRVNYTFDRARHRQTGEVGLLQVNGEPFDVFPVNAGEKDVTGAVLQKRDRLSLAILHQFSAEYRGEFMDERLVVTAGLRAPFFKRDLTNNCFTSSAGGFVECFGTNTALNTTAATLNPYVVTTNATTGAISVTGWAPPQNRVLNYKKILPNVGFVFDITENLSLFGNFSQGISVPGTDNLYNAFYFPAGTARAKPTPETTDNFDAGLRYRSGMVQAQVSGFYNQFHDRLASAYDPEINQTVYRNLGNVKKYGIDGSLAIEPIENVSLYIFGSVMKSKIRDNIAVGENRDGTPIYALTAGKREAGAPKYTFGASLRGSLGPVDLGITAKRTGERYIYDTNEATFTGSFVPEGAKACTTAATPVCTTPVAPAAATQVYNTSAPAYWLVNLDARLKLGFLGLNDQTFLQLNVYNLFDQYYVGGFGGNLNQTQTFNQTTGVSSYGNPGFVQIGAPRTISGTVVFKF
ncbi:TonB-dependent receptor [Novosphingobium ginsenosidimutans]|uniref:TonB-dependent receptor n=1 Tax=Novosphingobium ginsenosidimutans TaxID=1176536 RepID=A0A5B8S444_9SPHN|nr:TonB-dependent receptor [Novosphingobium ginsenosidimutans]QEA16241.1 TonB-dependent receptor [Novosphingobium ginsenosidimutans]